MGAMRRVRESILHATFGVVGLVSGTLSAIAVTIAAIVGASLGLLAFLLSPVRAIVELLRP